MTSLPPGARPLSDARPEGVLSDQEFKAELELALHAARWAGPFMSAIPKRNMDVAEHKRTLIATYYALLARCEAAEAALARVRAALGQRQDVIARMTPLNERAEGMQHGMKLVCDDLACALKGTP